MRAVVEIGVVAAAPVFNQRTKGQRPRPQRIRTRPTETDIPTSHIDMRAGVVTKCARARARPKSVGSCTGRCRRVCRLLLRCIHARSCGKISAGVQKCTCTCTCFDRGLGLLGHACLRHHADERIPLGHDLKRIAA